jgi:anhydro-N-acetylmuramic acid kinase
MVTSSHIKSGKVLLTGGGAFNKFLVERMSANAPQCEYFVPDSMTVNFKEALIFAFLGALYVHNIPNCLKSVTGAKYDNIGGALYKAGI